VTALGVGSVLDLDRLGDLAERIRPSQERRLEKEHMLWRCPT
jgi:hypothetical protein